MVYCTKCGTKNNEDAEFCVKCGKRLQSIGYEVRAKARGDGCFGPAERRQRRDEECFGVPRLGAIFGITIGLAILLFGVGVILSRLYRTRIEIWPLAVVVFGIMILAVALAALSRRTMAG